LNVLIEVPQLTAKFVSRDNNLLLLTTSEACRAIPRLGCGGSPLKGVALKTHQRLRLWKLQAFQKA